MAAITTAAGSHDSLQGAIVGMQIFLLVIALIMSGLRIYSRILIVHSLGPDDYIMLAATALSIGLSINASIGTHYGWGKHFVDIDPTDYSNVLLVSWIAQLLFTITSAAMKLSVLTFYLRLASTRTYKNIIYASIIWVSAWGVSFMFVVIFQCSPVNSYWIPAPPGTEPQCFNADPPLLVNGVTNILNDLWVYVLPMPMLWRVQLPRKQRIGLIALFSVGSLICIASGLRVYYSILVNNSNDGTYAGFDLWTWEAVEVNLGIACACAPALKPLLIRWFPSFMTSIFGSSNGGTGAANNNTYTNPYSGTFNGSYSVSARKTCGSGLGVSVGNTMGMGKGDSGGTFIQMSSPTLTPAERAKVVGGGAGARHWNDESRPSVMGRPKGRPLKSLGESEESLTDYSSNSILCGSTGKS